MGLQIWRVCRHAVKVSGCLDAGAGQSLLCAGTGCCCRVQSWQRSSSGQNIFFPSLPAGAVNSHGKHTQTRWMAEPASGGQGFSLEQRPRLIVEWGPQQSVESKVTIALDQKMPAGCGETQSAFLCFPCVLGLEDLQLKESCHILWESVTALLQGIFCCTCKALL